MAELVLVGEDSLFMFKLLQDLLNGMGYQAVQAKDGVEVIEMAQSRMPDLIIMGVEMPKLNGIKACKKLKDDARTYNIPIIVLTAHEDREAKLGCIEAGADDYVMKPFDAQEMELRIKMAIKRNQKLRFSNPITGLPGYNIIHKELERRLARSELFAAYHVDLDGFKPFNDHYGYNGGDTVIKMLAYLLSHLMKEFGLQDSGFLGHLGGDDFILVTPADQIGQFCQAIIEHFEKEIPLYYDENSRKEGMIINIDRQGKENSFPIMTLSIAVTSNEIRVLKHPVHVLELLTEILKYVKGFEGSNYHKDRRTN